MLEKLGKLQQKPRPVNNSRLKGKTPAFLDPGVMFRAESFPVSPTTPGVSLIVTFDPGDCASDFVELVKLFSSVDQTQNDLRAVICVNSEVRKMP